MIGKLAGRLDYKTSDHALIDVRGVGYVVYCSERTLAALPAPGTPVALYTDMLVREDLMQLFGFPTLAEKEWHKLLTSVQGVGAKASLAILGTLGPDGTGRAIALGDWNAIKTAKGIGPKIAQRVVQELKDRAPQIMALSAVSNAATADEVMDVGDTPAMLSSQSPAVADAHASAQAEALSALANLGYAPGDAARAVAQAVGDGANSGTASLIREALKRLAPAS
ncbi:MAG: Holliday junction branch migration protein RuvA [Pseudomonadota bacterium]